MANFNNLYQKNTRGQMREWKIRVEECDDGTAKIVTNAGAIGKKYTESVRHIKCGKNIGKANETSALEQAICEAKSMWKKRVDSGMVESRAAAEKYEPVFPMLAHNFKDHSKKIRYPACVQPKLDGVRALATIGPDGNVLLISRKNKHFNFLDHIREAISEFDLGTGLYLDGELFTKELPFEEIVGLCRKDKLPDDIISEKMKKIQYHIYDCFDIYRKDIDFRARNALVSSILKGASDSSPLKLVETRDAGCEDDVFSHYDDFFRVQGYEGAMVRNKDCSVYGINKRSYDLQKIKEFEDSEFKIVGFKEATGNDHGTIVWICKLDSGETFDVRPKATREERARLFKAASEAFSEFEGKRLTVQFQGRTNNGFPRFPVGIGIRDYE